MSDKFPEPYFKDIEKYINKRAIDFELQNISGIKEGDKHISKTPVGGRYYKEFIIKYVGNVDKYNPSKDVRKEANELKADIREFYNKKYFNGAEEHTVIHINEKNKHKKDKLISLKAHYIPDK